MVKVSSALHLEEEQDIRILQWSTVVKIGLPLLVVSLVTTIVGMFNLTLLSAPRIESTENQLIVFQTDLTAYDWLLLIGVAAGAFALGLLIYRRFEHAILTSVFFFVFIGMSAFITPILGVGETKRWISEATDINHFDINDSVIFAESGSATNIRNEAGKFYTLFIEETTYDGQNVIIYRLTTPVEPIKSNVGERKI